MGRPTDEEMFAWGEEQRARAAGMSNAELAEAILADPYNCVGMAEAEFSVGGDEAEYYTIARGVLREAAYRLAGVRQYEKKE